MFRKYFSNLHVQSNESKKGSSLHFIKKNKLITHSALPSLHELLGLKRTVLEYSNECII